MNDVKPKDLSFVLIRAAERLSLCGNLEQLTRIVADASRVIADADGATFVLKDHDPANRQELCYYVDENAISPLWKGKKFPAHTCISGWAMRHKEVVLIPDIYVDSRIPHDAYRPTFVKSLCMIPVRQEDPIAAIGTYWKDGKIPTPDQVKLLQMLANISAQTVENLALKESIKRNLESDASSKSILGSYSDTLIHDLKSPLTTILGLSDLLQSSIDTHANEKSKRYVNSLRKSSQSLFLQVEKVLGLYRASHQKLQLKYVDLKNICKDIVEAMAIQYPQRFASVTIDDNMIACADPILLRIVLENFLNNSYKFARPNSDLKIHIGTFNAEENFITFFIRDNGIGFKEEFKAHLFQRASQLPNNTTESGIGLGLYSASQIVKLHGGTVDAKGSLTEGATFYFSLPAKHLFAKARA